MIKLRKAKSKDKNYLHNILNNTPELRGINTGEEYPLYWIDGIIKDKKNYLVIIAEENRKICGFLTVRITLSTREAILIDVYVSPAHRKKGLGTKLIKYFEKMAIERGYHWLIGFIEKNNKKSQQLFEKLGYEKGNELYFYRKVIK